MICVVVTGTVLVRVGVVTSDDLWLVMEDVESVNCCPLVEDTVGFAARPLDVGEVESEDCPPLVVEEIEPGIVFPESEGALSTPLFFF